MPASLSYFKRSPDGTTKAAKWVYTLMAKWRDDGLYYKAQLVSCDPAANSCRVRFEDGLLASVEARDLHCQLNEFVLEPAEIVCCVCSNGDSEIVICDYCNQGYHHRCHEPELKLTAEQLGDESHKWYCATCKFILKPRPLVSSTPKPPRRASSASAELVKSRSETKRRSSSAATGKKVPATTTKVKLDKKRRETSPAGSQSKENKPKTPKENKPKTPKEKRPKTPTTVTKELVAVEETVDGDTIAVGKEVAIFSEPSHEVAKIGRREEEAGNSDGVVVVTENNHQAAVVGANPSCGGKVETMSPAIIMAAEEVMVNPGIIGTKDFVSNLMGDRVEALAPNVQLVSPFAITNGEKRPSSPMPAIKANIKKRPRKTDKPAAAAY